MADDGGDPLSDLEGEEEAPQAAAGAAPAAGEAFFSPEGATPPASPEAAAPPPPPPGPEAPAGDGGSLKSVNVSESDGSVLAEAGSVLSDAAKSDRDPEEPGPAAPLARLASLALGNDPGGVVAPPLPPGRSPGLESLSLGTEADDQDPWGLGEEGPGERGPFAAGQQTAVDLTQALESVSSAPLPPPPQGGRFGAFKPPPGFGFKAMKEKAAAAAKQVQTSTANLKLGERAKRMAEQARAIDWEERSKTVAKGVEQAAATVAKGAKQAAEQTTTSLQNLTTSTAAGLLTSISSAESGRLPCPRIVLVCCNALVSGDAAGAEELFRPDGVQDGEVARILKSIQDAQGLCLLHGVPKPAVAQVLLAFFESLPEPLINAKVWRALAEAEAVTSASVKQALDTHLPSASFTCCRLLFEALHHVCSSSENGLEHEAKAVACLISSKLMKPPPDSAGTTGWGHVELPIKTVEIMIADRLLFAAPSIA